MNIRSRVIALLTVFVVTITIMGGLVLLSLTGGDRALDRVLVAHNQFESANALAEIANHYSEQIAETLLIGPDERPDYEDARQSVIAAFQRFSTVADSRLVKDGVPSDGPEATLIRTRVIIMQKIFMDVDRAAQRAFRRLERGDRGRAVRLYENEIENRLDVLLEQLIRATIENGRRNVIRAEADAAKYRERLFAALGIVAIVTLGTGALIGFNLVGAITRPVRALMHGTAAIARGNLDHRITVPASDELGTLAARFNDMAEQLQAEQAAILGSKRDLEHQVTDRTRDLADANARLVLLDMQRVDLLADVSHELRTPLSGLRGEAEIVLRGASKSEDVYRNALARIVAQASDMARLVEDLLFVARSETGQVRFERHRTLIELLVAQTVQDVSAQAAARDIELIVRRDDIDIAVYGDERRLRQALTILLDNAIQYSGPGGQIEVSSSKADGAAEISVRDGGVGVPGEDLPHVFDRFRRGWNARMVNPGGSGLGLPIAKWIVERHGGTITLASGAGVTTASFRIPLALATPLPEPADRG